MDGGLAASRSSDAREAHLDRAYDEVAAVLEDVDLGTEPDLAEETIAALAAIDRATELATADD